MDSILINSPRVGNGYDVHALKEGLPMRLCGVDIPSDKGFVAHSDGDVAIHALCDALLGAAALGDIGLHFPDTAEEYRGADSRVLLARVGEMLDENGFSICNIDATIIAQAPKMRPHIDKMRSNIAETLGIPVNRVNVKATTEEKLGFTGQKLGISAQAVCCIETKE